MSDEKPKVQGTPPVYHHDVIKTFIAGGGQAISNCMTSCRRPDRNQVCTCGGFEIEWVKK